MRQRLTYDRREIKEIIDRCEACFISMVDPNGLPYVLPFNFAYDGSFIYLHSAKTGRKIDILNANPNVCVAFSSDHKLYFRHQTVACSYGMDYRSVLAFGKVEFINDHNEKERVLNLIMEKYTGKTFSYNKPAIDNVEVFRVAIRKIEGKVSGS